MKSTKRRTTQIGNKIIGKNHRVLIQTMPTAKTSNAKEVIKQIKECEQYGLDLIRVSIVDLDDVKALNKIKVAIKVPLIVDLHFDKKLALLSMDQEIDKIRINPVNLKKESDYIEIIEKARDKSLPVRLGFNEGSIPNIDDMLKTAEHYIELANQHGFDDFVLSFKFSNVAKTIEVYEKAYKLFPHPLHLGVTESGIKDIGLIKSSCALAPLLVKNIGDTIRISLTDKSVEEVKAARRLLKSLDLDHDWPELISCPSCGRSEVSVVKVAKEISEFLEKNKINLKVAIMGCPVNGPGEAKAADIGIAGSKNNTWILFKHGKIIRTIDGTNIIEDFKNEIKKL